MTLGAHVVADEVISKTLLELFMDYSLLEEDVWCSSYHKTARAVAEKCNLKDAH